ncbi:(Fe-S)-binding protein [Rhodovibrionaceae bacterium A322]
MSEGSLDAPIRHVINWQDPDFTNMEQIEAELERVFDICHGCRRCFNLCESFPKLFDLIDNSESGELDSVSKADYKPVIDACTLCDMCFMVSCPYVPPHEFDLDFPHLMLRYRAAELAQGKDNKWVKQLTKTDRNGRLASKLTGLANWGSDLNNGFSRGLLESIAGVDRNAALPPYQSETFEDQASHQALSFNNEAPAAGRKVALYATCFVNYNNPDIGTATRAILAKNGIESEVVYPVCCGMPQLEQGDYAQVAKQAKEVSKELLTWVDKGYDVVALVPSCALMMKFEWPLILPDDEDIARLSRATFDVTEYIVDVAKKEGLVEGLKPFDGPLALHIACHARAQNMGNKAREMLKLIPDQKIKQLPRCSGHGGSWGVMKDNFDMALKVGKPVARDVLKQKPAHVASECPLAGTHILQGMERVAKEQDDHDAVIPDRAYHPVELFALAYGIDLQSSDGPRPTGSAADLQGLGKDVT